jgi:hypothetical protein
MANNKTIKNKKLEKKFNDTADNVVKDVGKGIAVATAAAAAIETVKTYLNDDEMNGGKKKTKRKGGKWSMKYKKAINCKKPKGFSQKQYCKYGRKKN